MKFTSQKAKVAAVSTAILLFVLLLFVPRSPAPKSEGQVQQNLQTQRQVDTEVQEALDIMESEAPMQGILKLKAILEKDPHNIDASWHLGLASVRTNQFDKAVERFTHVVEHDHQGKYPEATMALGRAHEELGQTDKAIENYKRFLESHGDSQDAHLVRQRLADLDKKR